MDDSYDTSAPELTDDEALLEETPTLTGAGQTRRMFLGQGKRTLTQRAPWAVAAGFSLLHGLGFAGALAEVGLPTAEIPLALFSNVGIELGQLAFVGAVLLFAAALRKVPVAWPRWTQAVPAYGIGTMAVFWFLQRAVSLM